MFCILCVPSFLTQESIFRADRVVRPTSNSQPLEVGEGGPSAGGLLQCLRIVDLSPGEAEASVYSLYQQWLLLARRTAQRLLQVPNDW